MFKNKSVRKWVSVVAATAVVAASGVPFLPGFGAKKASAAAGPVSGKVFRDSNFNGTRDTTGSLLEGGVPNVTVRAYYDNNATPVSATTNVNGDYTLNVTGPVRVEVDASTLPAGMFQSDRGRPFTFFADGNMTGQDVPVVYPAEYVNNSDAFGVGSPISAPTAVAPAVPSGATDSAFAVVRQWSFTDATKGTIVGLTNTDGADADTLPDIYGISNRNGACSNATNGSLYGITMDPVTLANYVGAYVKRHVPLGSTNSPGTIYNRCTPWQEITGSAQPNPHNTANMDLDDTVVDDVGRRGVGGMDLASDMTALWAVDMTNERIVKMPFSTPTMAFAPVLGTNAFAIPNACGANTPQSMGLQVKDGFVYVGQTCEQVAGSVRVLRFNEASNTWAAAPVLSGALPTARGISAYSGAPTSSANWAPWTDTNYFVNTSHPFTGAPAWSQGQSQVMVADVDFDAAGNMILGIRNRTADLLGEQTLVVASSTRRGTAYSLGDVVFAARSGSTFTIESNPSSATEHFSDKVWDSVSANDLTHPHNEAAIGSIGVSPTQGRVMGTSFDPIDCIVGRYGGGFNPQCTGVPPQFAGNKYDIPMSLNESGVRFWNSTGGGTTDAVAVVLGCAELSPAPCTTSGSRGTRAGEASAPGFAKGNGLGDLLVYSGIAPVGIGNYVFADRNDNGIQDPSADAPISGVTVQLLDSLGAVVATTTTSATGFYQFWAPGNAANYTVRIPTAQFSGAGPLAQYTLATPNASINDESDSDGAGTVDPGTGAITSNVDSAVSIAGSGQSVRRVDFGFVPLIDLTLTKALTSADPTTVGSTVTFSLVPRNLGPGNAIAGWSVTDILPSGLTLVSMAGTGYTCVANTCTSSSALASGATGNTITVTATAASTGVALHNVAYITPAAADVPEVNILVVPNTSTDTAASATNNDAQAVVTVNPAAVPEIIIVKSINGSDANVAPGVATTAGSTMNITYLVTNSGNEALNSVVVTDDVIAAVDITCPATTLAIGASMTCTATYPAPAASALHTNIGTVNAVGAVTATPVSDTDPANATSAAAVVAGTPGIHVVKYINNNDANTAPGVQFVAGDLMNIMFEVTNTGTVALENVELHDSVLADADITLVSGDTDTDGLLDVTETWVYTATLAAPLAGQTHQNVATVTGDYTPPTGPVQTVTDTDPANAWTPGNPSIELVKTINGADANLAPGIAVVDGSTMSIEYTITNTGNVPLVNVILKDDVVASADITCPTDTLAVGGSMTCTATYPAPAAGVQHTNIGDVTGDYVQPNGQFIRVDDADPANAHVPVPPTPMVPAIEIVKTINSADANTAPGTYVVAGSTMSINFHVTNVGNTPLENVVVTDDIVAAVDITCPATVLAVGASMDCTATLPAPSAGSLHTNTGVVTADYVPTDGSPAQPVTDNDPANAWTTGNPQISIVKTINGSDANTAPGVAVAVGASMSVNFRVTNTGDVPLTNVVVTDSVLADTDITCPATVLVVGSFMDCTATLPAMEAANLSHYNMAQATGDFVQPDGTLTRVVDTDPANAHTPGVGAIKVIKYINDVDANTAPGVKVPAGSTMNIEYVVTNPGTAPLENVVLTDDVIPVGSIVFDSGDVNADNKLDPTETWVYTATFAAPAIGTVHTNVGSVEATWYEPIADVDVTVTDTDPANAWVQGTPELEIVKYINGQDANVAPGVLVAAGSNMAVTFVVTNTGDVTVSSIVVTDNVIAAATISCPATSLVAGASMTCTASLTAPAFEGTHVNTGTVRGTFTQPDGTVVRLTDTDPANAHADAEPGIDIVKYINGDDANSIPGVFVAPGSTMNITFKVTNTKPVALTNVEVTDTDVAAAAITCPATTLAAAGSAGDTMTCTATLAAPAPGTLHNNVATVTGDYTDVEGSVTTVTDADPANAWTSGSPSISIIKYINAQDANLAPGVAVAAASSMNVTFVVTNTGNVALANVKVTDSVIATADITCPSTGLAVGASMTCTATLAAPAAGVQHTNVAEVVGEYLQPNGVLVIVNDDDPANAYVPGAPGLHIEKLVNGDDADFAPGVKVAAGSTLSFEFIVTNIGQVPVSNVVVSDDTVVAVTYQSGDLNGNDVLEVNEVWTYTGTLAAPAAGVQHTNVATVDGDWTNPVSGTVVPLSDTDPANAWVQGTPELEIVKYINGDDANTAPGVLVAAGSNMAVTFVVTNPGDVTVTEVVVTDNVIPASGITCPATTLAAGASMTCTATLVAPAFNGTHTNTGAVTGKFTQPDGTVVILTDTDPANAHADAQPGIDITKYINGDDANAAPGVFVATGSTMVVTFVVKNTRPVALTNVAVVDTVYGAITCPATTLAAAGMTGDTMTCVASGTAPAAGTVHTNVATVTGRYTDVAGTVFPVTDSDPANAWTLGQPLIEVVKSINGDDANLAPGVRTVDGSTMNVTFEVRNPGLVTLTNVYVFDNVIDQANITCPATTLAAGASMTCTATYPAPAIGERHTNLATAHGEFVQPNGTITVVTDTDPANAYTPGAPAIDIVKTINGADANTKVTYVETAAGTMMSIEYIVTNTGNVMLENVVVTDPTIGSANITCPATILEAGEVEVCVATFPAPAAGTYHTNTGFVRGDYRPVGGQVRQVRDSDPAWAYTPAIDLELTKEVVTGGVGSTNDGTFIAADTKSGTVGTIRVDRPFQYRITVTNKTITGDVVATDATLVTIGDLIDPSGAIVVTGMTPAQGTCNIVAGTCDLGTIANGASVVILVDAVLPRVNVGLVPADRMLVNQAQVTGAEQADIDSTPDNGFLPIEDDDNPAWVKLNLADLELVKKINTVDNGVDANGDGTRTVVQTENGVQLPVAIGQEVTWTLTVSNSGPDTATGVTVSDVLPAEFQFVSAPAGYDPDSNTWTLPTMAVGATATLNIKAILAPTWATDQAATATRVINVGEVMTADQDDPDSIPGDGVVNADDIDDAFADPTVGTIGDYVWEDVNANGIQDSGEPGIAGVQVTLTMTTPVMDSLGAVVVPAGATLVTTTDGTGHYLFTNLYGGDYTIDFVLPVGTVATVKDAGSDNAIDSDADSAGHVVATLAPGATDLTYDLGVYTPASIGDRVWYDINVNGVQDSGELDAAGVTVTLFSPYGPPVTTVTDGTGNYLFDNLRPGTYHVEVTPPAGFAGTLQDAVAGTDATDSDASVTGVMPATDLASGEDDMTWDAGLVELGSIGDYVWEDVNRNGIQDADEVGVSGVTVTVTTPAGAAVATVQTDVNGAWGVTNLYPGDYVVTFTLPSGTIVTTTNVGADTLVDSNGLTFSTNLGSGEDDMSLDLGVYRPLDLQIVKTRVTPLAGVKAFPGDTVVWKVVVTNNGPSVALPGVIVNDPMPAQLVFQSITGPATGWTCAPSVASCTSTLAMAPRATAEFTVTTKLVTSGLTKDQVITNVATVAANPQQPETTLVNNHDDDTVIIKSPVKPITGDSSSAPLAAGALAVVLLGGGVIIAGRRRQRQTA